MLIGPLLLALAAPPKITISKETTYITSPLRPDGMVDYLAHFNAPLKEIKPEDNAAVLLFEAMGRRKEWEKNSTEFHRLLRLPRPPEDDLRLISFEDFAKLRKFDPRNPNVETVKEYYRCQQEPWTSKATPSIAAWIRLNDLARDHCFEATKRPRYVVPYVSPVDSPTLSVIESPLLETCRSFQRLLATSACLHAGEGQAAWAFEDLDAGHRLATLMGRDAKATSELFDAEVVRVWAFRAEQCFVFWGKPSEEFVRNRIAMAQSHPPMPEMADCVDRWARLAALDVTLDSMVRGGTRLSRLIDIETSGFDGETIDEALRTVNQYVDRCVEAMRSKFSAAALDAIEAELREKWRAGRERRSTFFLFRPTSPKHPRGPKAAAGEAYAVEVVHLIFPSLRRASRGNAHLKMMERLTVLAYAISGYKAKCGAYPERLDPQRLGVPLEVCVNPLTQKPFIYELKDGRGRLVGIDPPPPRIKAARGRYDEPVEGVVQLP